MFLDDQTSWQPFAEVLARSGYQSLTFDFRGYGQSSGSKNIPVIDLDMEGAYNFLRQRGTTRIFLIGSSMGGTAALKLAQRVDASGVVALSAPITFQGLQAGSLAAVSEPKLFLATEGDGDFTTQARTMYQQASSPKEIEVYSGSAHGTEMLGLA